MTKIFMLLRVASEIVFDKNDLTLSMVSLLSVLKGRTYVCMIRNLDLPLIYRSIYRSIYNTRPGRLPVFEHISQNCCEEADPLLSEDNYRERWKRRVCNLRKCHK